MSQCQFVHHKSQVDCSGVEISLRNGKPVNSTYTRNFVQRSTERNGGV